ncbi:hypothetical protein PRZ48_008259 [Zasmidium cellare]|uniref:NTF2 domain-containing protein n=1 Tax=Zasmidium cellare TaxID=395010 RepID=A0ABR0EFU0_ZASCE|nr:hypothetical protein PRZ48_008259 [Zasmidium cellare]
MAIQLSDTDKIRIATDTAESFVDTYYNALNSDRSTLKEFYVPKTEGTTPERTLPHIAYNGDLSHDGAEFQRKFEEMPYTYYEAQSVNAHILNPCIDPNGGKTQKEAERNLSITIQISGYVRLVERKDGPMRGFSEQIILVPNKEEVGGRGTGKTGQGRQFLIQVQNFRYVV